jgi:hypothetical protein
MTTRRLAALALAASLALPGTALAGGAKKPDGPKKKKKAPPVAWILKGEVTAYTAAAGESDGSLTITVRAANRKRADLRGDSITFVLRPGTKVILGDGELEVGERVIVKLKAPRLTPADEIASFVPRQVVDPADGG